MIAASMLTTVCVQTNTTIEEVVTWKYPEFKHRGKQRSLLKQSKSRHGAERDTTLLASDIVNHDAVGAILINLMRNLLDPKRPPPSEELMRAGRDSEIYLIHHPGSPLEAISPKSIKQQLVKALAKININAEIDEIQSILHATTTTI